MEKKTRDIVQQRALQVYKRDSVQLGSPFLAFHQGENYHITPFENAMYAMKKNRPVKDCSMCSEGMNAMYKAKCTCRHNHLNAPCGLLLMFKLFHVLDESLFVYLCALLEFFIVDFR